MIRHSGLLLACVALAGCSSFEDAVNYGRGPFDKSPADTSEAVLEGLHESSWGNSGRWGGEDVFEGAVLYVTNKRGNDLSVIDLTSGEETQRVPTCTNPHELAVSPDGEHLAVGCYGGRSVDIFSTATLEKIASVDLGENARPHGVVWHPNGHIYATAEGQRAVYWIRKPTSEKPEVFSSSTNKRGSHMLAVSPDGRTAWTTDLGDRTVTRVDLVTRRAPLSVSVGEQPEGISLSPGGDALWVSARGSDQAFELDPVTMDIRKTVATGRFPLRLAIRPQGDVAITSDLRDGSLSVIDLASGDVIRTIMVSSPEEAQERFQVTILWSAGGERIYVAETASDTVAELDYASGRVLRRLRVGDGGDGLAIRQIVRPDTGDGQ